MLQVTRCILPSLVAGLLHRVLQCLVCVSQSSSWWTNVGVLLPGIDVLLCGGGVCDVRTPLDRLRKELLLPRGHSSHDTAWNLRNELEICKDWILLLILDAAYTFLPSCNWEISDLRIHSCCHCDAASLMLYQNLLANHLGWSCPIRNHNLAVLY